MDTLATTATLTLHPIDLDTLARIRRDGVDAFGRDPEELRSGGGEQLRCCLRYADPDERLWVISHAPLTAERPWREVGPVYVHADPCPDREPGADFLAALSGKPRVIRGYTADQAMAYDSIRVTTAGDDLAETITRVFVEHPTVTEVHLRNVDAQCFIVRVTR